MRKLSPLKAMQKQNFQEGDSTEEEAEAEAKEGHHLITGEALMLNKVTDMLMSNAIYVRSMVILSTTVG